MGLVSFGRVPCLQFLCCLGRCLREMAAVMIIMVLAAATESYDDDKGHNDRRNKYLRTIRTTVDIIIYIFYH